MIFLIILKLYKSAVKKIMKVRKRSAVKNYGGVGKKEPSLICIAVWEEYFVSQAQYEFNMGWYI